MNDEEKYTINQQYNDEWEINWEEVVPPTNMPTIEDMLVPMDQIDFAEQPNFLMAASPQPKATLNINPTSIVYVDADGVELDFVQTIKDLQNQVAALAIQFDKLGQASRTATFDVAAMDPVNDIAHLNDETDEDKFDRAMNGV